MARRLRKVHNYKIKLELQCPNCQEWITMENEENLDIHATSDPCDLCGSHGEVTLWLSDFNDGCPQCNEKFDTDLILSEW